MSINNAFFEPLPLDVIQNSQRQGPKLSFDQFAKWINPNENTRDRSFATSSIILHKRPKKKSQRPDTHQMKRISNKERKKLGLYNLQKKELTYSQLLHINDLWKDYMRQLLNPELLINSNWNNSPDHPQFEAVSLKLYRADFHGAEVTVVKSLCPSLVGCSGIVAMETKNVFKVVGKDDICRSVPKKSCQFEMKLDSIKFQFYGNNFVTRPAERSSKKIKFIRPPCLKPIT